MKEPWPIPEAIAQNHQQVMDQLDIRAVLATIDRDRMQTQKLFAETENLLAQTRATRWGSKLIIVGVILVAIVWRLPDIIARIH